jgi:hypothetical protein
VAAFSLRYWAKVIITLLLLFPACGRDERMILNVLLNSRLLWLLNSTRTAKLDFVVESS